MTQMLGGLLGGGNSGSAAAAHEASPFDTQYSQYQPMLKQLVDDPSSVMDTNYTQFQEKQGINAVNAGAGASGMLNSGNRLSALEGYGQGLASTSYQQQFQDLALLSGAGAGSPGTAGQILQGQNASNQGGIASGLGGLMSMFGGSGSGSGGSGSMGSFMSMFGNMFGGGASDGTASASDSSSSGSDWASYIPAIMSIIEMVAA